MQRLVARARSRDADFAVRNVHGVSLLYRTLRTGVE